MNPTLFSYLNLDDEVDYGSDTSVLEEEATLSSTPIPEARLHSAPNPFAERGDAIDPSAQHHTSDAGYATITNPLD